MRIRSVVLCEVFQKKMQVFLYRAGRRRLAAGVNRLGAQVDHLSGLLHTDPPLRSCQSCNRPVTQLYLCSRSPPVLPQHPGPAPVNHAASTILLTSVLQNARSREPALLSEYRHHNPHYALAIESSRASLSHTDDRAHICYSCARSAMRYRRSYTATLTPGSLPPSDAACDVTTTLSSRTYVSSDGGGTQRG